MLQRLAPALNRLIAAASGIYGVVIRHFESGETFEHLPDEPFYAASIIKIPIMAAAFDQACRGKLDLSQRVTVRLVDMAGGSGVLRHLTPGLELPVRDLIVLMIAESDNTATNLLIDRIGIETVRQAMREWGLASSQLHHKLQMGPVRPGDARNTITAREMNELMIRIAQGSVVSRNACVQMIDILKRQSFNDGIPGLLPASHGPIGAIPAWEMAHKTGFVPGIEHDVGLLYRPGHTFAVSVLTKEAEDRAEAKQVMARIGQSLFELSAEGRDAAAGLPGPDAETEAGGA